MEVSCGFPGSPELLLVKHLLVFEHILGRNTPGLHEDKGGDCCWSVFSSPKQSEQAFPLFLLIFLLPRVTGLLCWTCLVPAIPPGRWPQSGRQHQSESKNPRAIWVYEILKFYPCLFVCCWIQCIYVMAGISQYAVMKIVPFACKKIILDFLASLDWILSLPKADLLYGARNIASLQAFV